MNSSCQVFYSYSSGNIQNIERKMPFPKHIFICMNTNATGRPGRATFRQSQGHFVWEDQHHCWGHDAKIRGRRRRPGGKYQLRRKMEQREKLIKKLALWGFGTKMCTGCNWRNLTKYQKCKGCNEDISGVEAKEETLIGTEEYQPFSMGLVAMKW